MSRAKQYTSFGLSQQCNIDTNQSQTERSHHRVKQCLSSCWISARTSAISKGHCAPASKRALLWRACNAMTTGGSSGGSTSRYERRRAWQCVKQLPQLLHVRCTTRWCRSSSTSRSIRPCLCCQAGRQDAAVSSDGCSRCSIVTCDGNSRCLHVCKHCRHKLESQ